MTALTIIAEYWLKLGESVFFQERRLVDCIARIRVDVLKIWNFNDPLEVSFILTYWGNKHLRLFSRYFPEKDSWKG
jgi:hypothetical protein